MGTGECNAGENLAMNKFPLEGGGRGGVGGSRRFKLQKPG